MKRFILVFLITSLISCAGCGIVGDNNQTNNTTYNVNSSNNVEIEPTTIYDANGIKVVVDKLINDHQFQYTVYNNTDYDIMFCINNVAVDNCTVYDTTNCSSYIIPHQKDIQIYDFQAMTIYGISEMKYITVNGFVYIYDDSQFNEGYTFQSKIIANNSEIYFPKLGIPSQAVLSYSDDSIEFYTFPSNEGISKFAYLLYNKTDQDVSLQSYSIAINGIMSENYAISCHAFAHGYCMTDAVYDPSYTVWSAFDDEVEEKGFNNVQSIICDLDVFSYADGTSNLINECKGFTLFEK